MFLLPSLWLIAPLSQIIPPLTFDLSPITSLLQALMIDTLHIVFSRWRVENFTKRMVVAWLVGVLSVPLLHISNTLRGVFHFTLKWGPTSLTCSPFVEESYVLPCNSILGCVVCFIWVRWFMDAIAYVFIEIILHTLTWPPSMHYQRDLSILHPFLEEGVFRGLPSSLIFHSVVLLGDKQEINMGAWWTSILSCF